MKKSEPDTTDTRPAAGLTVAELRALVAEVVHAVLDEREARPKAALLSQDQIAEAIGVSDRTVRTLRERGLPVVMVGDSPKFELGPVLDWLRAAGEPTDAFTLGADGTWTRRLKDGRSVPATAPEVRAALGPLVAAKLGK